MYNVSHYKRLGLKKKYYSSVSSADFEGINEELLKPESTERKGFLDDNMIRSFNENGYIILHKYISDIDVDAVNNEIDNLLISKKIEFKYRNKLMFAIHQSDVLHKLGADPVLLESLSFLFQGSARLFQSINFIKGSEQHTHSDSIHMTTFPLGGLLGVWLALEDIDEENGPLHYITGSHKLPYYLNKDYNNTGTKYRIGDKNYDEYEKMMEDKIFKLGLKKEKFLARKGDILIWHANLFHGGDPMLDKTRTRKSMVFHYYDTNRICYHEITQRPALL